MENMDTPEKTKIDTPLSSKFEDSPFFSYVNSLSPIKLVNSVNTASSFNSLSLASPPLEFTSPHASYQKETRFIRRNHFTDASKPDFSDCVDEQSPSEGISDALLGCPSPGSQVIPIGMHEKHSELTQKFPKALPYDCGTPDVNMFHCNKCKTEMPEKEGTSASLIQFSVNGPSERLCSLEHVPKWGKIGKIEKNKEASGCDLEDLILDAADMPLLDSFTIEDTSEGQDSKAVDSGTPCISTVPEVPQDNGSRLKTEAGGSCREHDMDLQAIQSGDVARLKETDHAPESLASALLHGQSISELNPEVIDKKDKCVHSGLKKQRSIRRLVFDMSGASKKRSICNYGSGSSIMSHAECKFALNEKQTVSTKLEKDYLLPVIPGIGLHLNALASTSNDINFVEHETVAGRRLLRRMPSCNPSDPLLSDRKGLIISLNHNPAEGNIGSFCNGVQVPEDNASSFGVGEEFNQSSPKKKRSKSELAAESEACKRCKCKKSKCLKLYCECFAAGLYCVEPCSCQDCFNKPIHEDTVMETRKQIESRNPLAFAPKVIMSSESIPEFGDESNKTPASARHKRGCNCKKSSCLKKYCECYQGGVGCSIGCRCEGCKNPFGCKYGTEETELEMEETDICERNAIALHKPLLDDEVQEEERLDFVLPLVSSSEISRSRVQLPCSSSGKLPQSSLGVVGSPLHMCNSQKLENLELSCKFKKRLEMIPEDEAPENSRGSSCSPIRGIKSTSPNCKRVSPPHRKLGPSPAWRNGRKLILRSIPSSYPSLTQHDKVNISGQPS